MRPSLRRAIAASVGVGSIVALAFALAMAAPSATRRAAPARVTVLYVGADDCAPCRTWQKGAGAAFRNSALVRRIEFREVKSPKLFDLLKDEYWPADLRSYRARLAPGSGAPLWFVVADDEVVLERSGLAQWQSAVLPRIEALLR